MTTTATTNSSLRPAELGIKHQMREAETTKTDVMHCPLDFHSVKWLQACLICGSKKTKWAPHFLQVNM